MNTTQFGFEPVAAAFALHYGRPQTPAHLERCLAAAVRRAAAGDSTLLEVVTDRGSNAAVHRELSLRAERAVLAGRGAGRDQSGAGSIAST